MKKALKILPILLILISCITEDKSADLTKTSLTNGTYYLNFKQSNDTLRYQTEKYNRLDWNRKTWRITRDSIFQEDSRGLSFYLGKDRRKYTLRNDTLCIWTNLKNETDTQKSIEQYLVLESTKKQLVIIDLNKNKIIDKSIEIRSDIQLR